MGKTVDEVIVGAGDAIDQWLRTASAWWLLVPATLFVVTVVCGGASVSVTSGPAQDPSPVAFAPCFESAILPDAATRFDCAPGAQSR